jgi:hypothetical protein
MFSFYICSFEVYVLKYMSFKVYVIKTHLIGVELALGEGGLHQLQRVGGGRVLIQSCINHL